MINEIANQVYEQKKAGNKEPKKLVNFKQMLRVQILKRQRKVNQQYQFESSRELRTLQSKNKSGNLLAKVPLPLEIKVSNQIPSDCNIKIPNKNSNFLIFPSVTFKEERKSFDSKSANRLQFFHKIRELSMKKTKEQSKLYKRQHRKIKSRYSSINFPQEVDCRTITPLQDDGLSQKQLWSRREQLMSSNKISQQKRCSSRYEDIPISEFIYQSNAIPSKEEQQKKYQSKLIKICRKKSLSKKDRCSFDT